MVSANPTGPLDRRLRAERAAGDAVARLLEYAGNEVEREYYFNDVGRQIELFRESVEARRRGRSRPRTATSGEYVADIAAEPGDPVERMLDEIKRELDEFRIHFDSWVLQREITLQVEDALPQLETYEAEGTVWARTMPSATTRTDRSSARPTAAISTTPPTSRTSGTSFERGFDRLIYVLGADHHGYVPRLKAAAAMLGYDAERLEALIYQLVHIVEGGQAKQSSKRRGDVVFLNEPRGQDRRGRRALVPRLARTRPGDRHRRRPGAGAEREEPRLLRPVRARPDRGDPEERRRRGGFGGSGGPGTGGA